MSTVDRVATYRARMRERGYRPVQIWVPDVRTAQFAVAAHQASLAMARADATGDDQDFVDAVSAIWRPDEGEQW